MALDSPDEVDIHSHIITVEASETVENSSIDTSAHDTSILDATGLQDKTFFIKNTTDVQVTVQLQGSPLDDGSEEFDIGSSETLSAGNNSATKTVLANNDAIRYIWAELVGGASASTGKVEIWVYAEGNTA